MNQTLRWMAAMAVAVGLSACAGRTAVSPAPQRQPVELSASDIRAIAQVLRYEDQRNYDAAAFDRLADGSEEVRRRVATAAGRIGDPEAVQLLVRMLGDDPSPAVRADAAFALGLLGDTSRVVMASLREAVPTGWVPVREAEAAVAVEVVQTLGKLGTFEARAMVLDALRAAHGGRSRNARRVAAEALLSVWRFEDGPGRVGALARYLDVSDPELRWRAAYGLMRMGSELPAAVAGRFGTADDAPRGLLRALSDDDHRARAAAARAMTAALADSARLRDSAVVGLTAALQDGHAHVRINAVRTLAGYGDDAPIEAMTALLHDQDPHVVIAAAGALTPEAAAVQGSLMAVLADPERAAAVHAAAAQAVASVAPDAVAAAVERWGEGSFQERYAAARSVGALQWPRAEPVLARLVADTDRRVAVAAVVAAGQLAADSASGADTDRLRGLLTDAARSADERIARVALRWLPTVVDSARAVALRSERGLPEAEDRDPMARDAAFYEDMVRRYIAAPLAGEQRPRARLRTAGGTIEVELLSEEAPLTVHNFVTLAEQGFWDDGVWHRVIPNFVLQDGAPAGDPSGGPGWSIRDEINRVRYDRGVMGMALAGPDTGGSQWFITHSPQHHLDGGYTIFGRVVDGMGVADRVLQGDPIETIQVR